MSKRFSEVEQWLFCATFPFILNAIAIAAALSMYQRGRIYMDMAAVTALVFAIALLLSLRAVQLKMRAEREQVQQATDSGAVPQ